MKLPNQNLETARRQLPLKELMERRGHGPSNGNWKSFPKCPFCENRNCAGVFKGPRGEMFKCLHSDCPTQTCRPNGAWDEIGYLAFEGNCDRREATRRWMKEAGVWQVAHKPSRPKSRAPSTTPSTSPSVADSGAQPPGGSDGSDDDAISSGDKPSPLQAFYDRSTLTETDRSELRGKRGLSDEMIERAGYRSNVRENLTVLQELTVGYSEWDLVKCGLWKRTENGCKPSGQYYGYGIVGKKKKLSRELLESGAYDELDDDDFVWEPKESGLCNPILIPYFNATGGLIALRPHRGFPKNQRPRLYVAGGRKPVALSKWAVIVEGEHKANALQDVIGDCMAVGAVPGITQVKNLDVWGDILEWLKRIDAKGVVVAFDSEEHGDPALPGFKTHEADRFDAEIWARVAANRLESEQFDARVAHLPDEWRENGKVDWDSALAAFLRQGKSRAEIKSAFLKVLHAAPNLSELRKASPFEPRIEDMIGRRVECLTYEPCLPFGGKAERSMARRLRQWARGSLQHRAGWLMVLADAYEKCLGWYFEFKLSEPHRERLQRELNQAQTSDEISFLKLALKGTPSRVAPFRLVAGYLLVKPDGTRDRLVRLINIRGEASPIVALDENSFTAPRDFRRWLARQGNYGWERGEQALQALQRDVNFKLGFREVIQLVAYGCERPGELWFLSDSAYAPDGTQIFPDEDGVFWHQGRGYTFLRNRDGHPHGEEGQAFRLKCPPTMRPGWGLQLGSGHKLQLLHGVDDEPAALQELLGSFVTHLNGSYSGHEGLMLIAGALAYFAGPEIFRGRSEFPGIWITGEKGGGKSYTAKWLMALHGFGQLESGISFKTSSAVGAQIAMGQMANIPQWGDEYKESELRDPHIKGVIHGGFNREIPSKWSADGRNRSIRTNFLITGETSCDNAATMSRFISVVAAQEKRAGTPTEQLSRLQWLQNHRQFFFTIGRTILRQRERFAARVVEHLTDWERLPSLGQIDPRARFSYGVSYAAFLAVNEIIPIYSTDKVIGFRDWLIERTETSAREVAERIDINQFWDELQSAIAAGKFGRTKADLMQYFKMEENPASRPGLSEHQLKDAAEHPCRRWKSYLFYFRPNLVFPLLRQFKHGQGLEMPLDQSDLLAQMKHRPYFVPGGAKGHQKKFERGAKSNSYCWCIDLDQFEDRGRRKISDEDYNRSCHRNGDLTGALFPSDEWVDPRKGELFSLLDILLRENGDSH